MRIRNPYTPVISIIITMFTNVSKRYFIFYFVCFFTL